VTEPPRIDLGDHVRIVSTPETEAFGYAGREAVCYGFTTPSVTGVSVVGQTADYALAVSFDGHDVVWFDETLVSFLDHAPGMVATVGTKRFVRTSDGGWSEVPDSA